MSIGERGPHGDHGQQGDVGQQGDTGRIGERGVQGLQGQQGRTGERGIQGVQGVQGPPYSSWLVRHVVLAYLLVVVGVLLSFVFTYERFNESIARTDRRARITCQAGNDRSRLAVESLVEQRQRTEAFDFTSLAIDPARAEDLKRQSLDSTDRQIASLPFLNCITGQRAPAPGVP